MKCLWRIAQGYQGMGSGSYSVPEPTKWMVPMGTSTTICFCGREAAIYLNPRGKIRRLTKAESYLTGFALSADGRKVAYAFDKERNGDTEFFLMDIDSGKIRKFSIPDRPAGLIGPKS